MSCDLPVGTFNEAPECCRLNPAHPERAGSAGLAPLYSEYIKSIAFHFRIYP